MKLVGVYRDTFCCSAVNIQEDVIKVLMKNGKMAQFSWQLNLFSVVRHPRGGNYMKTNVHI
jgi:hypothetical protein